MQLFFWQIKKEKNKTKQKRSVRFFYHDLVGATRFKIKCTVLAPTSPRYTGGDVVSSRFI